MDNTTTSSQAGPSPTEAAQPGEESGVRWTWGQLALALRITVGESARAGVDTLSVADYLATTQRTVQRLLRPTRHSPHEAVNPTDDRVRLLLELTRPLPETLTVQGQEAAYARAALDRLPRTSRGLDRSPWTAKRWLEPHRVQLRVHNHLGITQLIITRRDDQRALTASTNRPGTPVAEITVATRFHALLVAHDILTAVTAWRVRPHEDAIDVPRERTWLSDGPPPIHLEQLADQVSAAHPIPLALRRRQATAQPHREPATTPAGGDRKEAVDGTS